MSFFSFRQILYLYPRCSLIDLTAHFLRETWFRWISVGAEITNFEIKPSVPPAWESPRVQHVQRESLSHLEVIENAYEHIMWRVSFHGKPNAFRVIFQKLQRLEREKNSVVLSKKSQER